MRRQTTTRWLLLSTVVALLAAPFGTWGDTGDGGPESAATDLHAEAARPMAASEIDRSALVVALAGAETAAAEARAAAEAAAARAAAEAEQAATEAAAAAAARAAQAAATAPATAAANDPGGATAAPPPPPAAPSFETKGAQALAMISYPWQRLGYEIEFFGPVSGLRAKILRIERRIEVYVRPGDSVRQVAADIAHELGHAFDFAEMTWDERAEWKAVRGIAADTLWYGCSACTDYATPAGDWAEAFAVWQVGGPSRSEMAGQPTPEQLAVLARIAA